MRKPPDQAQSPVFFCCHEPVWPLTGGSTNGNLAILHELRDAGLAPVAVTPYNGSLREARRSIGVPLFPFRPFVMHRSVRFRTLRYAVYSVLFFFALFYYARKARPALLICRNTVLSAPVFLVGKLLQIPTAIVLADLLSYFFWHEATRPPLWQRLFQSFECHLAALHDHIFVVTSVMRDEICRHAGEKVRPRIEITRDGVHDRFLALSATDETEAKRLRKELCGTAPLAVFYGTLELHHGMRELLAIVPRILAQAPDLHVLIIGGGPCQPMLLASPLAKEPRVHLKDFMSHEPLIRHALAADVGMIPYPAVPSTHMIYTFKFLEYRCLGLPIVAFPLETLRREFGHEDGLHLAADAEDFADAAIRFAREGRCYPAAAPFRQQFAWRAVASPIVNLARKLVARKHK